ncbi:hypothetical protein BgiMline_004473 [Biomphalaria glabrata]
MFQHSALIVWTIFILTIVFSKVSGHGRLVEPPSRATMWRFGFKTLPNYDDNQLFCGGVSIQYGVNGGKCGVCGDPWNSVRDHEAGGKYATGILVRKYNTGSVIDVVIELTANHKGYFQFRLCPNDAPNATITQACLDQYLLARTSDGATTLGVPAGDYSKTMILVYRLQLPKGVKCRACLLQWKYNAGNSWGVFPNGTSCIGCGDQEQFYGCADIAIGYDDVVLGEFQSYFPYATDSPINDHTVIQNFDTDYPNQNCAEVFYGVCISSCPSFSSLSVLADVILAIGTYLLVVR